MPTESCGTPVREDHIFLPNLGAQPPWIANSVRLSARTLRLQITVPERASNESQ